MIIYTSFTLLTRQITWSTLEINFIFPQNHVRFSVYLGKDIFFLCSRVITVSFTETTTEDSLVYFSERFENAFCRLRKLHKAAGQQFRTLLLLQVINCSLSASFSLRFTLSLHDWISIGTYVLFSSPVTLPFLPLFLPTPFVVFIIIKFM